MVTAAATLRPLLATSLVYALRMAFKAISMTIMSRLIMNAPMRAARRGCGASQMPRASRMSAASGNQVATLLSRFT